MSKNAKDVVVEIRVGYRHYDNPGLHFGDEPSLTKQEMAKSCDVNEILKRYEATGMWPERRQPFFTDAPDIDFDFRQALEIVNLGERAFMDLPASLRARFDNDPAKYLDFISDPSNVEEARKLGMLAEPAGDDPQRPQEAGGGSAPEAAKQPSGDVPNGV